MTEIILTIHVLIVLGLIGVVLLQRSDGGALGLGGGGGGGFMTGRGAANALTRTTSILAFMFFATSLSLAILARPGESDAEVIEGLTGEALPDPDAGTDATDLLRTLGVDESATDRGDAEDGDADDGVAADGGASDEPAEDAPQR
ncbi:MAG: preprotein translocase subunit SecG [Parvularculaceae bacterium]